MIPDKTEEEYLRNDMDHIAVLSASLSNLIEGVDEHSYICDSIQDYQMWDARRTMFTLLQAISIPQQYQ